MTVDHCDSQDKDSSSSDSDVEEKDTDSIDRGDASPGISESLAMARKFSMGAPGGSVKDTRSSFAKRNLGTLIMKRRTTNLGGGAAGGGAMENAIQLSFAILPHG